MKHVQKTTEGENSTLNLIKISNLIEFYKSLPNKLYHFQHVVEHLRYRNNFKRINVKNNTASLNLKHVPTLTSSEASVVWEYL